MTYRYLFQVTAPHFVAGLCCDAFGVACPPSAPILKYMTRDKWHLSRVVSYCESKGWEIRRVTE